MSGFLSGKVNTHSLDSIHLYNLYSQKSREYKHMIRQFVTSWFLRTYRGEDEDGGGAAGNALVVVVLNLGDVVAEVAAVVHTAVAARYRGVQRIPSVRAYSN